MDCIRPEVLYVILLLEGSSCKFFRKQDISQLRHTVLSKKGVGTIFSAKEIVKINAPVKLISATLSIESRSSFSKCPDALIPALLTRTVMGGSSDSFTMAASMDSILAISA